MSLARNAWEALTGNEKKEKKAADPKEIKIGSGKAQEAKEALQGRDSKIKAALKEAGVE